LSVRARSLGIIALVGPDADALGCRAEIEHARTIRERGTSAHRMEVDWLIAETRAGL
jgi:hypothetical protein